ncbi:hypothetical protein B0J13DRAFT_603869 [Dactylonectria estremocensis]|uniref:Uncharacterized protein n=1 Tax=Dactylonectria estremocensis TaxID=1079267 RepID=A0A9P9JF66_9HYPO|nr:hypothetical protein B0J13DRAFT_603869 [Dactylonectria estremocensis]
MEHCRPVAPIAPIAQSLPSNSIALPEPEPVAHASAQRQWYEMPSSSVTHMHEAKSKSEWWGFNHPHHQTLISSSARDGEGGNIREQRTCTPTPEVALKPANARDRGDHALGQPPTNGPVGMGFSVKGIMIGRAIARPRPSPSVPVPASKGQGVFFPKGPKESISAVETQPNEKGNVCGKKGHKWDAHEQIVAPASPLVASCISKAVCGVASPNFRPASVTIPGGHGKAILPGELYLRSPSTAVAIPSSILDAVLRPKAGMGLCRYCGNPCASVETRNAESESPYLGRQGTVRAQPASHGVAVARPLG